MKIRYFIPLILLITTACGNEGTNQTNEDNAEPPPALDSTAGVDTSLGCGGLEANREEQVVIHGNTCLFNVNPSFTFVQEGCVFHFEDVKKDGTVVEGAIDQEGQYHFEILHTRTNIVTNCSGKLASGNPEDASRKYDFSCSYESQPCSFEMDFVDPQQEQFDVVANINSENGCGIFNADTAVNANFRKVQNTCEAELNREFVLRQEGCQLQFFGLLQEINSEAVVGTINRAGQFGIEFIDPATDAIYQCQGRLTKNLSERIYTFYDMSCVSDVEECKIIIERF